jgi:hypothetical protein
MEGRMKGGRCQVRKMAPKPKPKPKTVESKEIEKETSSLNKI